MTLNKVAGEQLDTVLTHYRLDIPTCLRLASQLAHTLADLHAVRLIHHDLHPANVIVSMDHGQLGLLDLRIASADDRQTTPQQNPAAADWAYFSPEQTGRMNRPVDYRADFYSLGMLFYRMLAGQLPFQGNDPLEWVHCHVARLPQPLRDIDPTVPQPVSDIVMRLLAKLPEDRYQSARGLQADLDRCLTQWQAGRRIEPFPLGTQDVPDHIQIPHKLYGREKEIAQLLAAFDRMAASGQAAMVTVSGYSGIGKSALVGELHQPILKKHGYFISGKFDQYQRDSPYVPLTQAFRELVQQLLAESEARISDWRQQIQTALGINGQLIVDVLPQVELIIGKQAPVPSLPPTEAQNRFHMAFRNFMAVFTRKEHPLVLFLDDLQWIDAASLKLVEYLLTHADIRYLLLIGAYRDNEVSPAHPLRVGFEAIRHGGVPVTNLELAPLSVTSLNRLVADVLHAQTESCQPLTRQIFERTGGNPFFFTQFLSSLREEGLLQHDANHRGWRWDLDSIATKDFADNVVDLVVSKLRRLPADTQHVLQRAACLGNKFELRRLALICGQAEVEQSLAPAIHEGLIVCANGTGKFLHDRIQQAAYSLLPQEHRSQLHLHIGRVLVANLTADELAESLFDVASQLNRGAALLLDRDEKAQVAQINLRAGTKAKGAAAYVSARVYLAAGMAMLEESDWADRYELMHQLWLERAECEFLSGDFESAEQLIVKLLQHSVSKSDQALAYRLKVVLHVMKSENQQAVASALACLHLFGIDMPAHPSWEQVEVEYAKIWQNLGERSIESLIDLPLMTDPDMLATMDVCAVLIPPAAFTDTNLQYLSTCHMVNLILKHGTSGASAYGYGCFGAILGPAFQRYAEGYRFAKLACDLVEKHGYAAYQAKVYLSTGIVALWTQPVASVIEVLRTAFRTGGETGDLATACDSCFFTVAESLIRGDRLDTIWPESEKNLEFVRKARFRDVADIIVSQQRFIASLRGQTANPSAADGAAFDEATFEAQLSGNRMPALAGWYWTLKMQARFLSGDYQAALAAFQQAAPLVPTFSHNTKMLDYVYYTALTGAAGYETVCAEEQRAWRERLMALQAQLREWAENYPPTFRDKYALVSAEIARLDGNSEAAMRLYEEAIRCAHANGFVQNEAIAYERASAFYRKRGITTSADLYLREARGCYARWGADGKVQQLDARYPQLQTQQQVLASTTPWNGVAQLDLLSVAKATQAISGRIVLDELADTLMRIVIENVGAQSGYLLLVRQAQLSLVAETHVAQQDVRVQLRHEPDLPASALPESILNYVRRSQEKVLLADATAPHPFAGDPYFTQRQPKSLFCLPIIRQATLIGLLYLENNLVTHAFTPDRVAVMELLASQAAISLENAQLYSDLQQENAERKRAEEALREREARIRRLVESNIIGIGFSDLNGGVLDANEAYLQIVGYSRQDLLSGKIRSLTAPEYSATDIRGVEKIMKTGAITPFESEFIRKDGSRVPVMVGVALLEGSPKQAISFVLDLTELKRAEEALRKAHEELERRVQERTSELQQSNRQLESEVMERKRAEVVLAQRSQELARSNAELEQMAYVASHDLQEPLRMVASYMELLERQYADQLDANAHEFIGFAVEGAKRMKALIQDLLAYSRVGTQAKPFQPINCTAAAKMAMRSVHLAIAESGAHIRCDPLPTVMGDAGQMTQLFQNLIANAIKFRRDQPPEIYIHAEPEDGFWRLSVQDNGIGIAPEYFERIFVMFQRLHNRGRYPGTGIGLALCKKIVEHHGGRIWVESSLGGGSTFIFTLPQNANTRSLDAPYLQAQEE